MAITEIQNQELTDKARVFFAALPHCIGYPGCDGDLEGLPHEPGCPLFTQKEMTLLEKVVAFAASVLSVAEEATIEQCAKIVEESALNGNEPSINACLRAAAAIRSSTKKG